MNLVLFKVLRDREIKQMVIPMLDVVYFLRCEGWGRAREI